MMQLRNAWDEPAIAASKRAKWADEKTAGCLDSTVCTLLEPADKPSSVTARDLVNAILLQPTTTEQQAEALLQLIAAHEMGFATKQQFLAEVPRVAAASAVRGALYAVAESSDDACLKEKICGASARSTCLSETNGPAEDEVDGSYLHVAEDNGEAEGIYAAPRPPLPDIEPLPDIDLDLEISIGYSSDNSFVAFINGGDVGVDLSDEANISATADEFFESNPAKRRRDESERPQPSIELADGIRRSGRGHASSAAADAARFSIGQ